MILIAPPLDDLIARACDAVDGHFAARARPASRQALDARKAAEARAVEDDGEAPLLAAEAEIRGIPVEVLAAQVRALAASADALERDRVRVKHTIRQCRDHAAVLRILAAHGVVLPERPPTG